MLWIVALCYHTKTNDMEVLSSGILSISWSIMIRVVSSPQLIFITYSSTVFELAFYISDMQLTCLHSTCVALCLRVNVPSTWTCHHYLNEVSHASFRNAWPSAGVLSTLRGTWKAWQWLTVSPLCLHRNTVWNLSWPLFILLCCFVSHPADAHGSQSGEGLILWRGGGFFFINFSNCVMVCKLGQVPLGK